MDYFCCTGEGRDDGSLGSTGRPDHDGKLLECDYDTSCTKLYKMIEGKHWEEIIYFLETSKWYFDTTAFTSIFFGHGPDPRFVEARTWVTALDERGSVRWCQLPLHAAITFQAPFQVIKKLVSVYPESIRCADDQDMLPLHYAFRFGSEDKVLAYILEEFPQATIKRALRDRLPLDMAHYSTKPERALIIECYVETSIANAKEMWRQQAANDVAAENDDESKASSVRSSHSWRSKRRAFKNEQRDRPLNDLDYRKNSKLDGIPEGPHRGGAPEGPHRGGADSRDEYSLSSTEDINISKKHRGFGNIFGRQKKQQIST